MIPNDTIGAIAQYGWLGVLIVVMVTGWRGMWHFDREFQREVTRGDKAIEQRDEAIDLARNLTNILEAGRRGKYRGSG